MLKLLRYIGIALPIATACVVAPASAQTAATPAWQIDFDRAAQPLYERGDPAFIVARAPDVAAAAPRLELWNERNQKLADLIASALDDKGTIRWNLPTQRNGYFEVRPAPNSVSWPMLGSRPANRLPFAVVDPIVPNPSRDYTTHFLSIQGSSNAGNSNEPATPNVYLYMGLQAQPVDYGWYKLQPKAGDFSTLDAYLANDKAPEQIRAAKTWPYFYLSRVPIWAIDRNRLLPSESQKTATSQLPPRDLKEYEAYLERVVPYIAKNYSYLPYRVYEMQWEPVIPWGWRGINQDLVDMFAVAHRVVHKYDPNGRVSGPTLSSFGDIPQYEALLKLGLGKYIDVSGWHMYSGYPPESAGIPAALERIRALDRQYVGRELPLFGTEFGLPEAKAGGIENQAYGMTAAAIIMRALDVSQHTLFYLTDYGSEPGYGLFTNDVAGLPYAPAKISPKPAIPMLRAAIDQIGTAHGIGKLDYLGADVWGYAFRDEPSGQLRAAIWDATGRNRTVSLDTGEARVQIADAFGNREERATKDGFVTLALSRAPVYVRGVAPALFAPAKTASVWRVFRGQKITQTLPAPNAKSVALILPRDVATSPAPANTKGDKAKVNFQIAPNAPLGIAAASVRVRGANGTIEQSLQRIEVVPELQISAPQLRNVGANWTLEAQVKNVAPARWSGDADLNFQNATRTQPLQLAPNQQTTLRFALSAPATVTQKIPAILQLRAQNGSVLQRAASLSFFTVQKADADVWRNMRLLPLRATDKTIFRTFEQSKFGGDKDLSAQAGYAYDAQNLYVQYVVEDDVHRNDVTPTQIWKQDSIQLAFDVAPGRETNTNGIAEEFERTNSEWGFAFIARGPEIYLWKPPGGSALPANSSVTGAGVKLEGGTVGTTTTYRITLPWKTIDPRAQHRDAIGIAAAINDSDADPGYLDRRALLLFDGILGAKEPALFGRAVLQ